MNASNPGPMPAPPIAPMLAKPLGHRLPEAAQGVAFEPKWDGFRCLVFVDGSGDVVLQGRGRSKSADEVVDLGYAFPEVVAAVTAHVPRSTILDAEVVIRHQGRLDFELLSSRLRPRSEAAGTNVSRLAAEFPATLLAFDVLWRDGDLMGEPFRTRRAALEALATSWVPPLHLTPQTTDRTVAESWFVGLEDAGVDGLIVKDLDGRYLPGKRAQGKVKHLRSADVVVAGWRPYARPGPDGLPIVGSLLLGLHDAHGRLHYVGGASTFTMAERRELVDLLAPLALSPDDPHPWRGAPGHRIPGAANRWSKEQAWVAVRPERVAEVAYDAMQGDRFRHGVSFVRWRPDRGPTTCDFHQLERPPEADIDDLLGTRAPLR